MPSVSLNYFIAEAPAIKLAVASNRINFSLTISFASGGRVCRPRSLHHPERNYLICFDRQKHQRIEHPPPLYSWLPRRKSEIRLRLCGSRLKPPIRPRLGSVRYRGRWEDLSGHFSLPSCSWRLDQGRHWRADNNSPDTLARVGNEVRPAHLLPAFARHDPVTATSAPFPAHVDRLFLRGTRAL